MPTAQLRIIDRAKDVGKMATGAMFAPNYIENKLKFFSHIKEAVCFGNGQDKVCAFVNIDYEAVGNWAERQGIPYGGYVDLASKPQVLELIADCIRQVNADLATEEGMADTQVARFLVLHKELDPDDDELTRTRKVRRNFIAEKVRGADRCAVQRQDRAVHRNPGEVRRRPHRQRQRHAANSRIATSASRHPTQPLA